MKTKNTLFLPVFALFTLYGALNAQAQDMPDNLRTALNDAVKTEIQKFLENDLVILSIENQNKRYKDLTNKKIIELDNLWRKQINEENQYLISATLSNPLSTYLTRIQALSIGKFIEIFVMDNKGLNVGQSNISSDFWQGDEAKFQKTYPLGPKAVFIDEPEYNADAKRWSVQYNQSISNKKGEVIGAATVEVNLTELLRLKD